MQRTQTQRPENSSKVDQQATTTQNSPQIKFRTTITNNDFRESQLPPSANTFLTSSFSAAANNVKVHHERIDQSINEKQSQVNKVYGDLQLVIQDLDSKFDRVLQRHQKDFLSAYRGHMLKVQKQLNLLRKKAKEQEIKLKKDQRINSLEKSLDWFRKEALQLGKTCEFQKKQTDKYKAKAESLQEDMKFLQQQIKASKKQNKLLKIALGKSQFQCDQLITIAQQNLPQKKLNPQIYEKQTRALDYSDDQFYAKFGNTNQSYFTNKKLEETSPKAILPAEDEQFIQQRESEKQLDIDKQSPDLPQILKEQVENDFSKRVNNEELENTFSEQFQRQIKHTVDEAPKSAPTHKNLIDQRNKSNIPKIESQFSFELQQKQLNDQTNNSEYSILPQNKRLQHFLVNLFEQKSDKKSIMLEISKYFDRYEERVQQLIYNLKGQLQAQKRLSRKLKSFKTQQISQRNKYEQLFFDCVESIKKDVIRRKTSQSRLLTKKSESSLRNKQLLAQQQLENYHEVETAKDLSDLLHTKQQSLTLSDKKRLLELFVCNEQVLLNIYECLFVKKKTSVHQKMRRTNQQAFFNSNPMSSGVQDDLNTTKYTEAFLTKLPNDQEGQNNQHTLLISGTNTSAMGYDRRAESTYHSNSRGNQFRFKTSVMPRAPSSKFNSANSQSYLLSDYQSSFNNRRVQTAQTSGPRKVYENRPNTMRQSKNAAYIRGGGAEFLIKNRKLNG